MATAATAAPVATAATAATVPNQWTHKDRVAYLKLGQKRINEHMQYYACVSLGAQLFVEMRRMREDYDNEKGRV